MKVLEPPCAPSFLAVEGAETIRAYEFSASKQAPLASVSLPAGFRSLKVTSLGGTRVAIPAWNDSVRPIRFGVWIADLRDGRVTELVTGEGALPQVAVLRGDRLVLGWPGTNIVTPATTWQPSPFGEQDWLAIDGRGDSVLVAVGGHPRFRSTSVVHLAPALRVEPLVAVAAALDRGSGAALTPAVVPELVPDRTVLFSLTSSDRISELELPGRYVAFGSSERYLALASEQEGRVRVGIKDRQGNSRVVDFTGPGGFAGGTFVFGGGGTMVFAGAYIALGLVHRDGSFDAYLVSPGSLTVVPLGKARPIAGLVTCD